MLRKGLYHSRFKAKTQSQVTIKKLKEKKVISYLLATPLTHKFTAIQVQSVLRTFYLLNFSVLDLERLETPIWVLGLVGGVCRPISHGLV